ncbi:MAG TPA: RDD family protein [Gammaproteobacteria bacterium]|nr:RDD family protein [Gammaproteobacteria bacterium]
MESSHVEYVGFWARFGASIVDTLIILAITFPILYAAYGAAYWESTSLIEGPIDFLVSWVLPAVLVIVLWRRWQATPGKMMVSARIVDANTGGAPTTGQLIGRYLGYYVSIIPFFLGLLWVAWDPKKQGWHDKLAGTVVVRKKPGQS